MLAYIFRRGLIAVGTVWAVSVISFVIISLPPGDYVTSYVAQLAASGSYVSEQQAYNLRQQYGLGRPLYVQYTKWMTQVVGGNFGVSMEWRRPVKDVIADRLLLTVVLALAALVFSWALAFPIGIYSAVRRYSVGDYTFTFAGMIGLAIPDFLLGLVLMYLGFKFFGANIGGLFSPEYVAASWSVGRVWDMLKHLWIPAIVIGTAGTAALIRIMRANLLDELRKPYVITARAKGLTEQRLLLKYPVRVALKPLREHRRIHIPLPGVGQHNCVYSAEPAHSGPTLVEGAYRSGYVFGGDHHPVDRPHDRYRHADFRYPAGVDRPAHPIGRSLARCLWPRQPMQEVRPSPRSVSM